jgi:hypothetical protein
MSVEVLGWRTSYRSGRRVPDSGSCTSSGMTGDSFRSLLRYFGGFHSIELFQDVFTSTHSERYFLSVALDLSVGSVNVKTRQ